MTTELFHSMVTPSVPIFFLIVFQEKNMHPDNNKTCINSNFEPRNSSKLRTSDLEIRSPCTLSSMPRGRRLPKQRRAGPALEARLTHACMHACMHGLWHDVSYHTMELQRRLLGGLARARWPGWEYKIPARVISSERASRDFWWETKHDPGILGVLRGVKEC